MNNEWNFSTNFINKRHNTQLRKLTSEDCQKISSFKKTLSSSFVCKVKKNKENEIFGNDKMRQLMNDLAKI